MTAEQKEWWKARGLKRKAEQQAKDKLAFELKPGQI